MSDTVHQVPLASIDLTGRLREIDMNAVEQLALSMKESGLITPIEVAPIGADTYRLVAGAHRVAAAIRLGWPNINAVFFDGSADQARMREIDENLYRRELSPFDQSEFVAERREVWERLYGDVKRGGDRRSKGQIVPLRDAMRRSGFVKETATRFNLHPKAVKRALQRKAHIDQRVWQAIRGTKSAENASFLDKLSALDLETQLAVLDFAKERGCAFEVAFSTLRREAREPAIHPLLTAIERGWPKASEAERRLIREFIKNASNGAKS